MLKEFPLAKAFHLIEPGPVVLLTTARKGRRNIMTMSWHMMMEFEPALMSCVVSPANYSFNILKSSKECVIAVPTVDLITKVVEIGNCSGEEVDKFTKFNLTALPAAKVGAPLVAECIANLECRVVDTAFVRKYALFVLEAVQVWWDPKRKERRTFHANGDGTFMVDGEKINLKRKMVKWKEFL